MSTSPTPWDLPPSTVLEARNGFVERLERAGYTPDQLFELLVHEGHVTEKFFVEYANHPGLAVREKF